MSSIVMSKLKLRGYTEADIDRLVELANNKHVSKYLIDTFPYPYTQKDAIWWIQTGHNLNGSTNFVIENDGIFVGGIGVTPSQGWKSHSAEIGYWIGEAYWNKGIGTDALFQMTDYAFHKLNLKKLFAPVIEGNSASMRILEKCGYILEGTLNTEVFKNDQFHNIHYYAKIYS